MLFIAAARAQSIAAGFESPGLSSSVAALAAFDPDAGGPLPVRLYAGGRFAASAHGPASNLAAWDGSAWSSVGAGTDGLVGALQVFDADGAGPQPAALYLGGAFTRAGSVRANRIARWDGTGFQALGAGLDDWVSALAVFDADGAGPAPPALYAGGVFQGTAGASRLHVARWNGAAFDAVGGGVDAPVTSFAVFQGALYAGGYFTSAGGVAASRVARWTGAQWQPVGGGFDGPVHALAVHDADGAGPGPAVLVAGGEFERAGTALVDGVALWDGSTWSALGGGIAAPGAHASVRALRSVPEPGGARLYATGLFRSAGSCSAGPPIVADALGCGGLLIVARWDGAAWSTLGAGIESNADDAGRALLDLDDDLDGTASLFVAGHFATAGVRGVAGVARWDGSGWASLGSGQGLSSSVHALAAPAGALPGGGILAAAGKFRAAGTTPANRAALWDGSAWRPVGAGVAGTPLDGDVHALHFVGTTLYLGGAFRNAGGVAASRVARWTGSAQPIEALGSGTDGPVHALASHGGLLVAGGSFRSAGGVAAACIAGWNGASWAPVGGPIDGTVRALHAFDDGSGPALYAGGDFQRAGGVAASRIARWNGAAWSPVGEGLGGSVRALTVHDDGSGPALHAGGEFEGGVARWDPAGGTWTTLGSGLANGRPAAALALASWSSGGASQLVAGGSFATAGGAAAQGLARWDGAAWLPLGTGANGAVRALLAGAGGGAALFAAGDFTVIDGQATSRIARVR